MRRIGLAFPGQPYSIREVIAAAQAAEAVGFDSVWIAEDLWTGRDAVSVISCLALETRRIRLCTGLLNPYVRHPVLIAMTVNALSELARGRLTVGIGAGMPWKPVLGDAISRWPPLRAVRETVILLRSLFSGEETTCGEETLSLTVNRPCFSAPIPPLAEQVPVYIGATGPRMTELAGEIADGLLLGTGTRRDEILPRLQRLAAGAARSGRSAQSIDVAAILVTSASRDGAIHPNTLGYAVKSVAALAEDDALRLGLDPERVRRVKAEYALGNCESAGRLLSPEMVSTFVAAGRPASCLTVIEGFVQAGVTLPILMPFGGDWRGVIELGTEYAKEKP